MAIKIDLNQNSFGVPFAGAYFRIVTLAISRQRIDHPRHAVMIDVAGYAAKPTNEDTKEIDFRRYHTAMESIEQCDGATFIEKAYNWVMVNPDMAGAEAA